MQHTWRWFGPNDGVSLSDVRQAGATGIVTALHDFAPGLAWPAAAIAERKRVIEAAGLVWSVVESLPVSEAIKTRSADVDSHIEAYVESLRNLAAEGIFTICYNFMPVLDWTRTELRHQRPNGGQAMRFDLTDFAVFDMHVFGRPDAARDFPPDVVEAAGLRFRAMSDYGKQALAKNIMAGLPGAAAGYSAHLLRENLDAYADIDADGLRANLKSFLQAVVPVAEELGLRLCCHPDDPPFPLLGLPRIVSTEADLLALVEAVPSSANGLTLCSGSLGARSDNDLPGMMQRLGKHVHFLHLRNTRREQDWRPQTSFFEDEHLGGDTDMVSLIEAVVREEKRRGDEGRADQCIPMRPDHGQEILTDIGRNTQPGYPAVGRLKGLAEISGVEAAYRRIVQAHVAE